MMMVEKMKAEKSRGDVKVWEVARHHGLGNIYNDFDLS